MRLRLRRNISQEHPHLRSLLLSTSDILRNILIFQATSNRPEYPVKSLMPPVHMSVGFEGISGHSLQAKFRTFLLPLVSEITGESIAFWCSRSSSDLLPPELLSLGWWRWPEALDWPAELGSRYLLSDLHLAQAVQSIQKQYLSAFEYPKGAWPKPPRDHPCFDGPASCAFHLAQWVLVTTSLAE